MPYRRALRSTLAVTISVASSIDRSPVDFHAVISLSCASKILMLKRCLAQFQSLFAVAAESSLPTPHQLNSPLVFLLAGQRVAANFFATLANNHCFNFRLEEQVWPRSAWNYALRYPVRGAHALNQAFTFSNQGFGGA